jgi:hypothetical protein
MILKSPPTKLSKEESEAFLAEAVRLTEVVDRYIALPSKRRRVRGVYRFTSAVLALCEETKCTNQVILNYYRSRQHSSRSGQEPRVARGVQPRVLDNWSRRYQIKGLFTFPMPGGLRKKISAKDRRLAAFSPTAVDWVVAAWRPWDTAHGLYRALKKEASREGWDIPSEPWFYRKWIALGQALLSWSPEDPGNARSLEAARKVLFQINANDPSIRPPRPTT